MRAVVQRTKTASVRVDQEIVGAIEHGFLILVGACKGDDDDSAIRLARRCAGLRVFEDSNGKMNLSLKDVRGSALVVSQFTLCADTSRGRRPSFENAMPPEAAEKLYRKFCTAIADQGIDVKTGRFGAKMEIELVNDGPVTLVVES